MKAKSLMVALFCGASFASAPVCANTIIVNGGFEDGVYSSTINGSTNIVPIGWTPSYGWDQTANFNWNGVSGFQQHSGSNAVFIGNDPGYSLATLSQTFNDVAGTLYQASFYLGDIQHFGYFSAFINGGTEFYISIPDDQPRILPYIQESFLFLGTGSDTLSFSGMSDAASFNLDDVSVDVAPPTAVFGAPGPVAGAGLPGFLLVGVLAVWWLRRRLMTPGSPPPSTY